VIYARGGALLENNYELLFVMPSDLKDDELSAVKTRIVDEMKTLGAVVEKEDFWGKRDLAYEVNGYHQGYYHLVKFNATSDVPNKLKGMLKVNERVIRYLISKIEPTPLRLVEDDTSKKPKKKSKSKSDVDPSAKIEDLFIATAETKDEARE
jgi:small subunit ribosomal protein S6